MKLNKRVIKHAVALAIIGGGVFAGGKFARQLDFYNPDYWQQEITGEKKFRLDILDNVSGLGADGFYSAEELRDLYSGILAATSPFDESVACNDTRKIPAYNMSFFPRKNIVDALNAQYEETLSDNRRILQGLKKAYAKISETGESLQLDTTDLDERVDAAIDTLTVVFSDEIHHQQDLATSKNRTEEKRWLIGGIVGFLMGAAIAYLTLYYPTDRRKATMNPY